MSVRSVALANISNEWRRASVIHKLGDLWNPRSIRDALIALATEGAIEQRKAKLPGNNFAYEYRLRQKETAS